MFLHGLFNIWMRESKDYGIEYSANICTQRWYLVNQWCDQMSWSKLAKETNHCVRGPCKKPDEHTRDGDLVNLGLSGEHICEGESHVLVLAPHLLVEYVDSPDYDKVIIYDEDHEDNKAGEGHKEDITHILHGVDAVLKTASQQKTF